MKRIHAIPSPPSTLCFAFTEDLDHCVFDADWLNQGGAFWPDRFTLDQSHDAFAWYGVPSERIESGVQRLLAGERVTEVF